MKAELTATERVGFHRYTFPASEEANLIFNIGTKMGESGPARDASVTFTEDGRIEGWVVTEPVYVDIYQKGAVVKMYFSAVVDAEPASWGAFCGEEVLPVSGAVRAWALACTCVSIPVRVGTSA